MKKTVNSKEDPEKPLGFKTLGNLKGSKEPKVIGKWKILNDIIPKNTILDNCASSITGICKNYPLINECVNECEKSDKCDYGYYIQSKNGNICLPMNSELRYDYYNPTYNWIKNNDSRLTTFAFINTEKIHFPDNNSNSVFFNDIIYLKNEMGNYIYTPRDKIAGNLSDIPIVGISNNQKTELKISLKNPYNPDFISNASLREGIPFVFVINNTGYILRKNKDNNDMGWVFRGGIEISDADSMAIVLSGNKQSKNNVYYGQKFFIKYLNGFLNVKNNKLVYSTEKNPQYFMMESNHSIYSCVNGKCKQVENIDRKVPAPKFKGEDTYRSDTCFDVCDNYSENSPKPPLRNPNKNKHIIYIVFFIYVLYIIFVLYTIKYLNG